MNYHKYYVMPPSSVNSLPFLKGGGGGHGGVITSQKTIRTTETDATRHQPMVGGDVLENLPSASGSGDSDEQSNAVPSHATIRRPLAGEQAAKLYTMPNLPPTAATLGSLKKILLDRLRLLRLSGRFRSDGVLAVSRELNEELNVPIDVSFDVPQKVQPVPPRFLASSKAQFACAGDRKPVITCDTNRDTVVDEKTSTVTSATSPAVTVTQASSTIGSQSSADHGKRAKESAFVHPIFRRKRGRPRKEVTK